MVLQGVGPATIVRSMGQVRYLYTTWPASLTSKIGRLSGRIGSTKGITLPPPPPSRSMTTSTKYVGTCPVCENRQKVRDGLMVHHGYQRPGWGQIVGDCFAVGMEPYETSPRGCELYLESLQESLKLAYAALDNLKVAKKVTFTLKPWRSTDKPESFELNEGDAQRYTDRGRAIPSFDKHKANLVALGEQEIKHIGSEITRITRRITAWKPSELTKVEEEVAKDRAAKKAASEAKKAERAAKAAAKQAKADERRAKQIAKVMPQVEEARRRLDEAAPKGTKAVQKAFLWVVTDGLPKTNEPLFWSLLDRDQIRRDAGLVRPWNDSLVDDRWSVQHVIDGTLGK